MMGRPSNFTPETTRRTIEAVRSGSTIRQAAAKAGIGTTSLVRWLRRGKSGEPQFRHFAARVDRARAEYRAEVRAKAEAHGRQLDQVESLARLMGIRLPRRRRRIRKPEAENAPPLSPV